MLTIWKFPFQVGDEFSILMPRGAHLLSVAMQGDQPCVWALVNSEAPKVPVRFRLYGTGHPVDGRDISRFVGTFQMHGGGLVFHLFTAKEPITKT
jgi:hypothetical protein